MSSYLNKNKNKSSFRFHNCKWKRGYFSKWGIIIELISTIDFTEYITCPFFLLVVILPTPKKDWILFNKCKSLPGICIEKIGETLQPIALFSLLVFLNN